MDMTPERWRQTSAYLAEVFGPEDGQRRTLMERAEKAGIPQIAVRPEAGRALQVLASLTGGGRGARLAVELGTLAGYSALWIVRALAPGGRLICVEPEAKHADFALAELERAGVAERVEIRRAKGLEVLAELAHKPGPGSVDFLFLDAIKTEYPDYFRAGRALIAPGGLIVADNALGSDWWIDMPPGSSASRDAMDKFNRMVAADPDFVACCFPIGNGLLVARRRG